MKKFLSLVLALVMTMSLVTVSAGAKDYADASEIKYVEAVDVLSTLGVLEGDAAGFRPTDTLKRSEAAKIICALNLTPDVAATLSADAAPFADVAKSHWAAGYIAEGVSAGIIAGVGGNKFAPDAELTGYAYLKMLLVCLGYDASVEGMTGANWSIEVAKLAKKVGLTKGNDNFVGSKAVTREEAALYALNALQAEMVEYADKGTNITIGDLTISASGSKAEGTEVTFMAENYKDLKLASKGVDALGRPAKVWSFDGDKIGTYASTADYTLTLTKAVKDLCDYLDDEEILEDAVYAEKADYYVNGEEAAEDTGLKAGSIVEVYADDEEVTDVAVINYSLAKIEKVSTSLKKAEKADGAEAKLTIAGKAVLDIDIAGYDEETYVKGAYILYVMNAKDEIIASVLAESIEGEVEAKKSGDVKIDGEYYDVVDVDLKKGNEGTFYLNAADQIILFVEADEATSDEYAYIYNTKTTDGETNDDGVAADDGLKVYVVLADGTKAVYTVEEDSIEKVAVGKVVPYTINDDDEFEVVKAGSKIDIKTLEDESISKKDADAAGIDVLSSTEFIFVNWNKKTLEVDTATGYKNVAIAAKDMVVVSDDGEAAYIFVVGENGKLTTDTEYAVILDADAEEWDNDDDEARYTYTVAIEGEEKTLDSASALKVTEGDVVSYELEDGLMTNVKVLTAVEVTSANEDYFRAGARYEYTGEEDLYTITMEYTDGDLDEVSVENDAVIEEEDKVIVILNSDDELAIVFVYDIVD